MKPSDFLHAGMYKAITTNVLDAMESSKCPRMRALAEYIGSFVPRDWANYFF